MSVRNVVVYEAINRYAMFNVGNTTRDDDGPMATDR